MKRFLALVLLIAGAACSRNNSEDQDQATQDSLLVSTTPHDTLLNYFDLAEIHISGDTVALLFAVGEGGDEVWLKTKIDEPNMPASVVGNAWAGVDGLSPMPEGYTPTQHDFTYQGKANPEILGNQFYLEYFNNGSGATVVLMEERGDMSGFYGEWKMLGGDDREPFFPLYAEGATPTILIQAGEGQEDPVLVLNRGQAAEVFIITSLSMRKYSTVAEFNGISRDDSSPFTFTFTQMLDDNGEYRWDVVTGVYEEPRKFVHPQHVSLYREKEVD